MTNITNACSYTCLVKLHVVSRLSTFSLSHVHTYIHTHSHALLHSTRLLSLSKSSLADSQFVAGIHPEADPEQSAGILSVLTGEKNLPERWAVRVVHHYCYVYLRITFGPYHTVHF